MITILGHYKIIERIGAGGMGVVYKARDLHLDRFVAVKVLPPEKVADPDRKRRFVHEAKAASALNHPNIVHVYDIDRCDGIDYIAMEFVAGKTLDELIPRKGMRLSLALRCAAQVADALARAHVTGIIHRDVKPSNVMVDDHGLVKVLDFGLAKLTESVPQDAQGAACTAETMEESLSERGAIVGTAAYMSPEQAEGKPLDARSDIFSFGSVLYEMLSGQKAFQGDSKVSTLSAVLNQEPKPLREVPHDLQKVVARCLRKDPERRFQSMADLRVALQELKEESDSGKLQQMPGRLSQRRGWKWAAGGALALLLAAAALIILEGLFKSVAPLEASLLTSLPGITTDPTFSPDGRQVAFSWNGEKHDKQAIYLKLIGAPTPKQLSTGPGVDLSPVFSPDGLFIAFCRWSSGNVSFVLIPSIGGPERTVAEFRISTDFRSLPAPYFAWFPDGKTLATLTPLGLAACSIETGERSQLTTAAGAVDATPAVSPNSRRLAFTRKVGNSSAIYILELTEDLRPRGEPRRLTPLTRSAGQPAWTADGKNIVFVSDGQLWIVPASGSSHPRRLPLEDSGISSPVISGKGNRLVYCRSISNINIWRMPLTGPESERIPQKLIASTRSESGPQYSPDGSRIAFHSSRTGRTGIWVSDADGSNAVELFTPPEGSAGTPRWAPNGQRIAFDVHGGEGPAIFTIAARGGKPVRLETDVDGMIPSWSRDGAWVYFSSLKTGRLEIWKAPAGGGPAQQVTRRGGFAAFESLDGKFLYYTKTDRESGLWKVSAGGGEEVQILPSVINRAFSVADSGIYFATRPAGGKCTIQFLRFATGQVQILARIEQPLFYGLTVSPDDRFALYPQVDASRNELMLVDNFR